MKINSIFATLEGERPPWRQTNHQDRGGVFIHLFTYLWTCLLLIFYSERFLCLDLELTDFFSSLSLLSRKNRASHLPSAKNKLNWNEWSHPSESDKSKLKAITAKLDLPQCNSSTTRKVSPRCSLKSSKKVPKRLRRKCCSCKSSPELSVCTSWFCWTSIRSYRDIFNRTREMYVLFSFVYILFLLCMCAHVMANEAKNSAERIHNMTHTKTTA